MGANTQSYPTPNPLPQPWESDGDFYLSIANPMYEAPCYFQVNDARARLDPQSPSYGQYGPTPSGVILDELLLVQSRERVAAMANPYSAQFSLRRKMDRIPLTSWGTSPLPQVGKVRSFSVISMALSSDWVLVQWPLAAI